MCNSAGARVARWAAPFAPLLLLLCCLAPSTSADSQLDFAGDDDRVTVPYDNSFPTQVFTVSAWIRTLPSLRNGAIIARGEDDNSFNLSWQLYVVPNGTLEMMLEPFLFFYAGFVVGEFRDIITRRSWDHWRSAKNLESKVDRLREERDVLAAAAKRLEKQLLDQTAQFRSMMTFSDWRRHLRTDAERPRLHCHAGAWQREEWAGSRAHLRQPRRYRNNRLPVPGQKPRSRVEALGARVSGRKPEALVVFFAISPNQNPLPAWPPWWRPSVSRCGICSGPSAVTMES